MFVVFLNTPIPFIAGLSEKVYSLVVLSHVYQEFISHNTIFIVKQVYCSTPTFSPATSNGPSSTAESSVNIPAEKTNQSDTKPEKPQHEMVKPKSKCQVIRIVES